MAIMYPLDMENYDYTATEKEMYLAFKEQLPDKFHVFYSIRWFDMDKNKRRVDSECDFLVFDPSFGFLTIEVKGGIGIEIEDGNWYLIENRDGDNELRRKLKCSPYKQAEKSMRHFHDYFVEEFNQNFRGVYGCAAAFPRYMIDESISHEAPKETTIDLSNMSNLQQKINEIFHYWRNKRNITIPFSSEQRQRFIHSINKRISLSAAAGALIPIKEKEFKRINFLQNSILDILYHYHQVRLVGGAGTGKTYIAMKKAVRDAENGKQVLVLCRNEELSKNIRVLLPDIPQITCTTFESLMGDILGDDFFHSPVNTNGCYCCFDMLGEKKNIKKYDSIIIDEAQDFDIDMGLSVRCLLKDDKHSDLYVFYDENQNVFEQNFENAFLIEYPPFILRYNIRNTGNIYQCATDRTRLGTDTIANHLLGVEPEILTHANVAQTLKTLTNIVNRLTQKEFVSTKSIVLLSDDKFEDSILAGEQRIGSYNISFKALRDIGDDEICFKTSESFKGLEADIVIYLKSNYEVIPNLISERCKEYVALTRARYYLYILNTKKGRKNHG